MRGIAYINLFVCLMRGLTIMSTTNFMFLLAYIGYSSALTDPLLPEIFYPFGRDVGDAVAAINDDGFAPAVAVGVGFPFFNTTRKNIFVNTNGAVSFDAGVTSYIPNPFPIAGAKLVAPYWTDIDTTANKGRVYYRQTTDPLLIDRAAFDIQSVFASQGFYFFQPLWLFVATWHNVTYFFGDNTSPVITFQCILATDGVHSFALFHYGKLTWSKGVTAGAVSAQVGFNAGDAVNFYTVEWSRTTDIVNIYRTSNVGVNGRWAFRIDNARITPPDCTKPAGSACYAWQTSNGGLCTDIAPAVKCPKLTGPTVIDRLWFEFYCEISTDVTDPNAMFEVTFTFDGRSHGDIPVFNVDLANPVATLHEKYLHGKLGKWIGCKVVTYWKSTPGHRSSPVPSENNYKAGIEASRYELRVKENGNPAKVSIRSTLPITCQSVDESGEPTDCFLPFSIYSSGDIAVRQQKPESARKKRQTEETQVYCLYAMTEADWNSTEGTAENNSSLDIIARLDMFLTNTRLNWADVSLPELPNKTVNGESYENPWNGYQPNLNILVFRNDAPTVEFIGICNSWGDPHITTFDGVYYHSYATGTYVYLRTTHGLPIEVHVRHYPCPEPWTTASCICAVAVREDELIMQVDMCKTPGIIRPLTNDESGSLPIGAEITKSASADEFTILVPSGLKVVVKLGAYSSGYMDINIYMTGNLPTVGLCGSFDANPVNDLTRSNGTVDTPATDGFPVGFVESWRVQDGYSIFDNYKTVLPRAPDESVYCVCNTEIPICGTAALLDTAANQWDKGVIIKPRIPLSAVTQSRKRRALGEKSRLRDDIDYIYDTLNFTEHRTDQFFPTWPTPSGITKAQAETECRSRIYSNQTVGPLCMNLLSTNDVAAAIRTCADDVLATDGYSWVMDKVSILQRKCMYAVATRNYTTLNDTASVLRSVKADVAKVAAYFCEPADCRGHGNCSNGTCLCTAGYTGSDCSIPRSAVPSITTLMDTPDCDARVRLCQSLYMGVANASADVRCNVEVTKTGGQTTVYSTAVKLDTRHTLICSLPKEPLELISNRINFTAYGGPGFDFGRLPLGSAVLTYAVSISNDGVTYSEPQTIRVVDTLCMNCDASGCSQKPTACLINGYCFEPEEENPFDNGFTCQPTRRATQWSSMTGDVTSVTDGGNGQMSTNAPTVEAGSTTKTITEAAVSTATSSTGISTAKTTTTTTTAKPQTKRRKRCRRKCKKRKQKRQKSKRRSNN